MAAPEVAVDGPVESELQTATIQTAGKEVLVSGIRGSRTGVGEYYRAVMLDMVGGRRLRLCWRRARGVCGVRTESMRIAQM